LGALLHRGSFLVVNPLDFLLIAVVLSADFCAPSLWVSSQPLRSTSLLKQIAHRGFSRSA